MIDSTMRRDPNLRPTILELCDKIRVRCDIRTPVISRREASSDFKTEIQSYTSFSMPRVSYLRHLAPRAILSEFEMPPSLPVNFSQQRNAPEWSPPHLLTSLLSDSSRFPMELRLRLPQEDEEQTQAERDSSYSDADSRGVDPLPDPASTSGDEEARSQGISDSSTSNRIGPTTRHDSEQYRPISHNSAKFTKVSSSNTLQSTKGTQRIPAVPLGRPGHRPSLDRNDILAPPKPPQLDKIPPSQKQNFREVRGPASSSTQTVSTTAAPAGPQLPLRPRPRGILKNGTKDMDSGVPRSQTPEIKSQDRRELENLPSMRPGQPSVKIPLGQSSTRSQGRSSQQIAIAGNPQTAGVDLDRQSDTSSSAPSEQTASTVCGQLQTKTTDRPSRTPSPLIDDIGPLITWISPTPSKVNGHFCDVFEGKHSKAGKVALKRPRIGATGYDEVIIR
ncbi:hypothetical protein FRC01_001116, partial [Tulasnella sp. 417]